ncbi:hypothetical protein [Rhodospirillum sp. A1_3_36]|uniref:hypothetical protein n=1 Tax=Rhodospirillum sp. A1_3_36 TaxID=3391666 RepID=UPI0039A6CE4E
MEAVPAVSPNGRPNLPQHSHLSLPLAPYDPTAEISQAFVSFLAAIIPGADDRAVVRDGATRLARRLARVLSLEDGELGSGCFVGGALGRRTAILIRGTLPTIDLFLTLTPGAETATPGAALDATARAARALGLSPQAIGPRAVTLREEGLRFALIPTVNESRKGMGGRRVIPGRSTSGASRWIPWDPLAEAAALRVLGMVHGERPRMLLAILKAWRSHNRVPLSGYALDVLVQAFFQDRAGAVVLGGRAKPQDLFESFMAWGRNATPGGFPLPGGGRSLSVGDGWHGQAASAYWLAVQTRQLCAKGDVPGAASIWRTLLGEAFPEALGALDVGSGVCSRD